MFHWMKLRAFVYATEDRERVIEAMKNTGIEGDMSSEMAEGAYGDRIEIIQMKTGKNRDIKSLFSRMSEKDISAILETLEQRVDDDGILHFRLDKQELYGKKIALSSGGDVISVEVKVEAYPFTREKAVEILREYLRELR